jgi:hypothetical protein
VDCADIRDAFLADKLPQGAEVEEHVRWCPHCQELLEGRGLLGEQLAGVRGQAPDPDLLAAVERDLAQEKGVRAWLRSRPTPVRFALVLSTAALVFIAILTAMPRQDLAYAADNRWVAVAVLFVLGAVLGFDGALRVLGRAQPRSLVGAALTVLLLPLLVALLPEAELAQATTRGMGADFPRYAGLCFFMGVLVSAPVGTVLWFASRDDRLTLSSLLFVAGGAGVAANLAMHAHCSINHPGHLIAGHATIGVAWLLALLLMNRLLKKAGRGAPRADAA